MIGLIKKDLYLIKRNIKLVYIVVVLAMILAILEGSSSLLSILPFISMSCIMATFSFDDLSNWNAYSATFSEGRVNCVRARYISTILTLFANLILVVVCAITLKLCGISIVIKDVLFETSIMILLTLFILYIMYPLIYKFGAQKAGIIFMIIMFVLMALLELFPVHNYSYLFYPFVALFMKFYYILIPIAIILFTYISYIISKIIYLKEEF